MRPPKCYGRFQALGQVAAIWFPGDAEWVGDRHAILIDTSLGERLSFDCLVLVNDPNLMKRVKAGDIVEVEGDLDTAIAGEGIFRSLLIATKLRRVANKSGRSVE